MAISHHTALIFAPRERSVLARPGRAWCMHEHRPSSERATKTFERSFGAWYIYYLIQALPGLANVEGSFGAKTNTSAR